MKNMSKHDLKDRTVEDFNMKKAKKKVVERAGELAQDTMKYVHIPERMEDESISEKKRYLEQIEAEYTEDYAANIQSGYDMAVKDMKKGFLIISGITSIGLGIKELVGFKKRESKKKEESEHEERVKVEESRRSEVNKVTVNVIE